MLAYAVYNDTEVTIRPFFGHTFKEKNAFISLLK